MKHEITEKFLLELYFDCDEFVKHFESYLSSKGIGEMRKRRCDGLSIAEIMTILVAYQHSGHSTFQYFYKDYVCVHLRNEFTKLPTYERFVALIPKVAIYQLAWAISISSANTCTGISYIDSKKLPVCRNQRIHQHKVFHGIAARGKSSTGWYYGLKIHLIINHLGDIISFALTPANVQDNNPNLLRTITKDITGLLFGDKGYISSMFEELLDKGVHLVTKVRRNMKNKLMGLEQKLWLMKRGVIEAVNDILMTVHNIEHTRHRSPVNAVTHLASALIAYDYYPDKPTAILNKMLEVNTSG